MATMMRNVGLVLVSLPRLFATQVGSVPVQVNESALRANASVYPVPEYRSVSLQAKHTGRVVIEVLVALNTKTRPLARAGHRAPPPPPPFFPKPTPIARVAEPSTLVMILAGMGLGIGLAVVGLRRSRSVTA